MNVDRRLAVLTIGRSPLQTSQSAAAVHCIKCCATFDNAEEATVCAERLFAEQTNSIVVVVDTHQVLKWEERLFIVHSNGSIANAPLWIAR